MTEKEKLKKLARFLFFILESKASFYRDKYKAAGFTPAKMRSIDDIVKIPFLTRSELMHADIWSRLFVPIGDTISIGYTSGTTKQELLPLWRNYFLSAPPDMDAQRILITPIQPWRVLGQSEWFRRKGVFVVCGDVNNLALTGELAATLKIDSVYTSPAIALLLVRHFNERYDLRAIRHLVLYGEKLSAIRRDLLKTTYPRAKIVTHYALSEIGPAGNSCPVGTEGDAYHQDENFLYEVVDPLTGERLPPNQVGEIVISTLVRTPTPMIRYRTGDMGIIPDIICPCASPKPLFKILGRINFDIVKAGGFELRDDAFEGGIETLNHLVFPNETEVHVFEERDPGVSSSVKLKLVFKLAPRGLLSEDNIKNILELIRKNIKVGRDLTVGEAEQKGYILTPKIEIIHREVDNQIIHKKRILVSHL
ncbi:hypothetical protein A3E97_03590 [Candidatus Uhrbacteria bacterium RIFCSPHIGHO2_12_FULL_47_12]|nr:MAG: hypothetical protein A2839_04560 [Candidatus Uhrbacteria bacterium RIFCSPHIGHO2_01_FULL_47_10]OGL77518.1 MAG: hypothetical protein A3E97_03590 [Candidatus Uhrbacteria bacterium RIFCSPHIGHO2_12_FULL_47_12]